MEDSINLIGSIAQEKQTEFGMSMKTKKIPLTFDISKHRQ